LQGGAHVVFTAKPGEIEGVTDSSSTKEVTLIEFLQLVDVSFPAVSPGLCYECNIPTVAECVCGESFCSISCHASSWQCHAPTCHQLFEQQALHVLEAITEGSWRRLPTFKRYMNQN